MWKRVALALLNRLGIRVVPEETWRRELESLAAEQRKTVRRLRLVEATLQQNRAQEPLLRQFRALCASGEIEHHVRHALSGARIVSDPTPHLIVSELFPAAFYSLCLDAIPPEDAFTDRDRLKQNFKPRETSLLPDLVHAVWTYLDAELIPHTMAPAIARILEDPIRSRYAALFGEHVAGELLDTRLESSGGRLMLRRPGYFLAPHLDVTRAAVTTLIYFARPGDDPSYGTQLFRVHGSTAGRTRSTYYPEEDGARCELAVSVPFHANSALVFLNAGAAHGASIPAKAPKDTRRYSFQFYLGPTDEALHAAVSKLPDAEQQTWADEVGATSQR
jgi:hypothetical protein